MPLYEYKCKKCDSVFEYMQKFSDEPLKKCIHCGGGVEKLISLSSFHLKGGGWYATDYSKKEKTEKQKECGDSPKKGDCSGCPSAS